MTGQVGVCRFCASHSKVSGGRSPTIKRSATNQAGVARTPRRSASAIDPSTSRVLLAPTHAPPVQTRRGHLSGLRTRRVPRRARCPDHAQSRRRRPRRRTRLAALVRGAPRSANERELDVSRSAGPTNEGPGRRVWSRRAGGLTSVPRAPAPVGRPGRSRGGSRRATRYLQTRPTEDVVTLLGDVTERARDVELMRDHLFHACPSHGSWYKSYKSVA